MRDESLDRVVPLDQLDDFKVADGEPDVRGWEVIAADGKKIGEVENLLVDTDAMKVRYLDVELDGGMLGLGNDRHVLLPIGHARLDRDDDRVLVDGMRSTELGTLPEYSGRLDRGSEDTLRQRFDGGYTAGATTGETRGFYEHEAYDQNKFYGARREVGDEARLTLSEEELAVGKREVSAGEVGIRKTVETEHVRREVPLSHEEVTVERRPITDGMHAAEARIEGDEIRIPLHEEEAVVSKRVVPKEELVVKKRDVVETEVVETDLRREHAEVDREGDVRLRDGDRTDLR